MGDTYQRRMVAQRDVEARRESLCRTLAEDSRVQQVNGWQQKQAAQQYRYKVNRQAEERREDEEARRVELDQLRRQRESQQESLLASEMRRKKHEDSADTKRIELIIQGDPRLRELQRKLKLAHVTKERTLQLKEKATFEYKSKLEEAQMDQLMVASMKKDEERREQKRLDRAAWVEASKKDLLVQMQERKQLQSAQAKEEFAQDQRDVDAVIAQIMREEHEATAAKAAKQAETRSLLSKYQEQHRAEKEARSREELEHEAAIAAYQAAVYKRAEGEAKKKEQEAARQEGIYKEILKQQEEIRAREEELLDIRETLSLEEVEQRELVKEAERAAKIHQMKQDMIAANEAQKRFKSAVRQQEALDELDLQRKVLKRFEEDCEKERQRAKERARQMREHRAAVEQQREDRYDVFRRAQEQEREQAAQELEEAAFRERVVQEAARRLLEQHKDLVDTYGGGMRNFAL